MNQEQLEQMTSRFLEAWTSQDVARVIDCYTGDLRYRDPNTRGEVAGREAMGTSPSSQTSSRSSPRASSRMRPARPRNPRSASPW